MVNTQSMHRTKTLVKSTCSSFEQILVQKYSYGSFLTSQQTFVLIKTSPRRLSSSFSLSEDFFKRYSRFLDQDEYIRLSHTSSEDVLVKTNIFILATHLQDVFKTFSTLFKKIFAKISNVDF